MTPSASCSTPPVPAGVEDPRPSSRPLGGGAVYTWSREVGWYRIYHRDQRTPTPVTPRRRGPVNARFDHHLPPLRDQDRSILYAGESLAGAVCEALASGVAHGGDDGVVSVCPNRYVAVLRPTREARLQDLASPDSPELGEPDDLGDAAWDRDVTQQWARAIYEDRPAAADVGGVRYWSARHRRQDGGRAGRNVAIWDSAPPVTVVRPGTGVEGEEHHALHAPTCGVG